MYRFLILVLLFSPTLPLRAEEPPLPSAEQWAAHVQLLARYWLQADGWGEPVGNFPTWRCNDGQLYRGQPCAGFEAVPEWIQRELGRTFVRMQSRQAFAYGVLFQLTGDQRALALHEAGIAYLKRQARDPVGGFYTWFEQGRGQPSRRGRTSQDLAYALLAFAFNAYLSHDPESLQLVAEGQRYIYSHYWDHRHHELRWTLDGSGGENPAARELVAQLDQLNGYLLLSWRLWPDQASRQRWTQVIRQTSDALLANYYDPQGQRFWGTLGQAESRAANGRHNDFGHTGKAFWMLLLAGSGLGDESLVALGRRGLAVTIERADHPLAVADLPPPLAAAVGDGVTEVANWAASTVDDQAPWWIWAELDQGALTLALHDSHQRSRVAATLQQWLRVRSDGQAGEMKAELKQHHWRNGYHSLEHALVGTLLSNSLRGEATTLYFAPVAKPLAVPYTPYLFAGDELGRRQLMRSDGRPLLAITFAPAQWPTVISQGTR